MTGFGSARQSWAPPKQADSGGMAAKNEQSARSGGGTMPNGRGSGSSAETPAQSKSKPSTQNRHGDTAKPGRMKPVSVYMDVRSGEAYEVLTEYDSGEDPEDGEYKDGNRAGKRGSGAVAAAGPGKKGGTSKSTTTTTTSTNSTDNDAPGPGSKDRKRPRRQVAARAAKHLAAVPAGLAGPSASTCKTATSFTVPSRDLRSRSSSSDIIIASDPADLTASETRNGPPKRSTTSSRNKPTMNADGRGNAVAGESRRTVGKSRQAATINLLDSSDEEDAAAQASDIGNAPPSRATRIAKRSQRPPVPSSSDDAPKDVDEVEQPGDEEEEDMGELPTALAARMAKRAKKLREPIPSFSTPDVDSQKPKAGQSDKDGPGGNGRPEATVPAHILAGPSTSRQARALQTPLDLAATTAANRQPPGAPRRNQTDPVLLGKRKRIHVAKDGNDGNEDGHGDEGQKKEKAARGSASQPVPIDAAADVQPPAVTASAPVPAPAPAPEAKPVITPDPEENVEVQAEHEHVGAEPTPEDLAAIAALTAADKEVAGAASASTNTSASASASAPHDPTAAHLARILEILPDADMNYILAQIATYAPAVPAPAATVAGGEAAGGSTTPHQPPANKYAGTEQSTDPVERVLADAFEKGYEKAKKGEGSGSGSGNGSGSGSGPASGGKGKRKRQGEDYKSKEYRKGERAGRMYERRCREWLEAKFELVPLQFIRQTSKDNNLQLTPTYYVLAAAYALPHKDRPFNTLKSGRKGKSKAGQVDDDSFLARLLAEDGAQGGGKGNAKMEEGVGVVDGVWVGDGDEGEMEFVREREWLLELLDETDRTDREAAEKAAARDLALAEGHGIECGCCFTEEIMDDLVQCQEGHLFCKDCVKQLAEVAIGEQKHKITCMDQTSCQAPFLDSTLYSVLSEKSIALYERLKQQSELEAAGLEGLETCPDCSFAAIIDNPDEKLFRCLNETCGKVSCRGCWKEEHLPRSCAEVEAEKHLDKRHAIEDAMSKALIRECPKPGCKTKFVKSDGCNKMICTKCRTMSCYVCRVIIKGYEHFEQTPQDPNLPRTSKGCFLWDDMAKADQDAVLAARDAARAEQEAALAADGQAVPAKMLEVDAPPAPPPARLPGRPLVANPAVAAQMADLHARAQAAHHHLRVQALQPAVPAGMLGFGAANPVLPVYHRAARRDMARNIDEMMHAVAGAGLPLGAVRPGMHANADVPIAGGLYGDDDGNDRAGHMGAGFRFGDPIGFGLQAAAAAQAGIGRAFGFGAGHGVGRAQQPGAYPGPPLGVPENGLGGREGDAAARVRLQADRERRNDMAGQVLGAVRR